MEDLKVLQNSEVIADDVWKQVGDWDRFARDMVGKQLVRAVNSVGENIAEAYGRYHFGEKLKFLYYARGSLFETKYWLNRCQTRRLINDAQLEKYARQLNTIGRQLNNFANSLKSQKQGNQKHSKQFREPQPEYKTMSELNEPLFSDEDLSWLESISSGDEKSPISNLQSQKYKQ
ncbi:MAG: four helix bundle protein [Chloroflexi bacterium]|nr:four helix bundle protein [Chloroflexota bacterium]